MEIFLLKDISLIFILSVLVICLFQHIKVSAIVGFFLTGTKWIIPWVLHHITRLQSRELFIFGIIAMFINHMVNYSNRYFSSFRGIFSRANTQSNRWIFIYPGCNRHKIQSSIWKHLPDIYKPFHFNNGCNAFHFKFISIYP